MPPQPRPGILATEPYQGGEKELPGFSRVARLASNENPFGASPRALEAYDAARADLNRYPDGHSAGLRAAIGEVHGLDPARIVCGAGSDELIALLTQAYAGPGDRVVYSRHGFLMYPIFATTAGATPVAAPETELTADVDAILARVTPETRAVFLANPNNPTGTYLSGADLARLHAGLREDVLLVIDAAYAEYATAGDYSDGAELAARSENVVVTRTFSKIYGLAGLRIGWAYGPPAIADVLNRLRMPFNLATPAQAAGDAAVRDRDFVARSVAHNTEWRGWFRERARAAGIEALPSEANFVLLRFAGEDAADAALATFKAGGVLVRQMGKYGLPDCLRVSIGGSGDMQMAADALDAFAGHPA